MEENPESYTQPEPENTTLQSRVAQLMRQLVNTGRTHNRITFEEAFEGTEGIRAETEIVEGVTTINVHFDIPDNDQESEQDN